MWNTIEICTMHNRPPRMSSKTLHYQERSICIINPLFFLKLVCSLYMARDDRKKWSMGKLELVWACLQLPYIVVIFSTWIVLWKEAIWEWLSLPTNVGLGPIWAKVHFNPYNLTRQKLGFAISRHFSPKSHMPTHHSALWDSLHIELGL